VVRLVPRSSDLHPLERPLTAPRRSLVGSGKPHNFIQSAGGLITEANCRLPSGVLSELNQTKSSPHTCVIVP
jgi:hypothetical protein